MANVLQSNQSGAPNNGRPLKKTGTGYTNIQSLVGANDASKLGNNIAGNVGSNVNKTVGNIQNAQSEFNKGTQDTQNSLNASKNNANTVLNQIVNAPSTATYSPDSQEGSQNLVNNQDVQNYSGYLNSGYNGPQDLNNKSALQSQQSNASQYAGLLGSQPGQQQLLRTFVNSPNYTNSLQNLDSLYLGKQGIQNNLKQARTNALQQLSQNNVNDISAASQQQAANNTLGLQQNQQGLRDQTQNAISGIDTTINNQLESLKAADLNNNDIYNQLVQNNFGATDAQGNAVLNNAQQNVAAAYLKNNIDNPQNFFQFTQGQNLNKAGAASQQQAAQLAALGQLTNNSGLNLGSGVGSGQASNLNIGDLVGDATQRTAALSAGDFNNLFSLLSGGAIRTQNPYSMFGPSYSYNKPVNADLQTTNYASKGYLNDSNKSLDTLLNQTKPQYGGQGFDSYMNAANSVKDQLSKYFGLGDIPLTNTGSSSIAGPTPTYVDGTPVVKKV